MNAEDSSSFVHNFLDDAFWIIGFENARRGMLEPDALEEQRTT